MVVVVGVVADCVVRLSTVEVLVGVVAAFDVVVVLDDVVVVVALHGTPSVVLQRFGVQKRFFVTSFGQSAMSPV